MAYIPRTEAELVSDIKGHLRGAIEHIEKRQYLNALSLATEAAHKLVGVMSIVLKDQR